jgi:hypothetical protein
LRGHAALLCAWIRMANNDRACGAQSTSSSPPRPRMRLVTPGDTISLTTRGEPMKVHLLDATYEFAPTTRWTPCLMSDGREVGADGVMETTLSLLREPDDHLACHRSRDPQLSQPAVARLQDRGRRASGSAPISSRWRSWALESIGVTVWPTRSSRRRCSPPPPPNASPRRSIKQ